MINKSYAVYILEKYISLLQLAKYIMLKSLITYVSKGFKLVLRNYITFKNLNFVHMNSSDSFHPTSDVMGGLSKFYFSFVTYGTDLVNYVRGKRCFIKQAKVSE